MTTKHLPGRHSQATHGRNTARRQAFRESYRAARTNGATIAQARAQGKHASAEHRSTSGSGSSASSDQGRTQAAQGTRRDRELEARRTTRAFGSDPNRIYEFKNRLVEMDDLITSNTANGGINPAYSAELQPRDRRRAASQQQIDTVAKTLVPESILWDFKQIDKGPPIIGADRMVESGNGRTLALQRARDQFPERWHAYQDALKKHAEEAGFSAEELSKYKNPVLVRERVSDVDRASFAREANAPPVLQMSPIEKARIDSHRVTGPMIDQLHVSEGQSIDAALRAAGNQPFVRSFVATLPDNEAATVMRSNGTLNQTGIQRIKAAMFVKIFPGEAGDRLADTFIESLDSNIKNFETATSATMPRLARAQNLISSGARARDLDLSEDISKSVDMLARLREDGKQSVFQYLRQDSMFNERELTHDQERILEHFDKIGNKPTAIKRFYEKYAKLIEDAPDPAQGDLFGGAGMTKGELIDRLLADGD